MTGECSKIIVGTVALLALLGTSAAKAGTYSVRACWRDGPGAVVREYDGYAPAQCGLSNPGNGQFDFMAVGPGPGAWPHGTSSRFVFSAPPATFVTALSADLGWSSPDNTWTRELWDLDSGAGVGQIPRGTFQPFSISGISVHRLAIGMRCTAQQCSGAFWNGQYDVSEVVTLRRATFTLRDDEKPQIVATKPPPEIWLSHGGVPIEFNATDNVGVKSLNVLLDGASVNSAARGCYDEATNREAAPCSISPPALSTTLDVDRLAEGAHTVTLRAIDPAREIGDRTFTVLVDRSAPGTPRGLVLDGAGGWRSRNAFDVHWAAADATAGGAPITAASYQVCPASNGPYDPSGCRSGVASGMDLTRIDDLVVPRGGEWRVTVALRDAAGNGDPDRIATVDGLRFDDDEPVVSFNAVDPADPIHVAVDARDPTSGVVRVEVETRRRGESTWHELPVAAGTGRYTATVDDAALPAGTYELRARAVDFAGNERTTGMLQDGRAMTVSLPLRGTTALEVGHPTRVRVKAAKGKRPTYRLVLVTKPISNYGRTVQLSGRVTDDAGNPRDAATVDVSEQVSLPGMEWRHVASVTADHTGTFVFRAVAGPARVLRFAVAGTATTRPVERVVELRVRAGVTLVPGRTRVANGDSVMFRGALRGRPFPLQGKLLSLQALTSRGWRTFATPRASGRTGRWSYRYHFTGTPTTTRYAFRVVAPLEAGYPYAGGMSPVARVTVTGGG